jgi:hypothetical protein
MTSGKGRIRFGGNEVIRAISHPVFNWVDCFGDVLRLRDELAHAETLGIPIIAIVFPW